MGSTILHGDRHVGYMVDGSPLTHWESLQGDKHPCVKIALARFLNRKSQRYYRLKFADTYYGEMTHYGLYRLAWADVRRAR